MVGVDGAKAHVTAGAAEERLVRAGKADAVTVAQIVVEQQIAAPEQTESAPRQDSAPAAAQVQIHVARLEPGMVADRSRLLRRDLNTDLDASLELEVLEDLLAEHQREVRRHVARA